MKNYMPNVRARLAMFARDILSLAGREVALRRLTKEVREARAALYDLRDVPRNESLSDAAHRAARGRDEARDALTPALDALAEVQGELDAARDAWRAEVASLHEQLADADRAATEVRRECAAVLGIGEREDGSAAMVTRALGELRKQLDTERAAERVIADLALVLEPRDEGTVAAAERMKRERDEAWVKLGLVAEWSHKYGAALVPGAGVADTYGEGVRACKDQVRAILRGPDAEVRPLGYARGQGREK